MATKGDTNQFSGSCWQIQGLGFRRTAFAVQMFFSFAIQALYFPVRIRKAVSIGIELQRKISLISRQEQTVIAISLLKLFSVKDMFYYYLLYQ